MLKRQRKGFNETQIQLNKKKLELEKASLDLETLNRRILALNEELNEMENTLVKTRQAMNYRLRSDKVLNALTQHYKRFIDENILNF